VPARSEAARGAWRGSSPGRTRSRPGAVRFLRKAGGIPAGDPENRVTLEEWRRFILGNPLLDDEASVVVVDTDGSIVSLAWLLVDDVRRRAENEWTATLPHLRGRGLALLAKLGTIRWAAANGVAEIVTGNDPENRPMRELNRRLGYRELFLRRDLERPAPGYDRRHGDRPT
jgi:hypothetical protein